MLREGGILLALLLVAALILKIAYQIDNEAHNPLAQFPVSDELLYISDAADIASGTMERTEVFHSAPLYPYLLAPLFSFFGTDALAARMVQALMGVASVLLFYLTARLFFARGWALIAGLVMLLYYPFAFFEGKLLIITSAVFFMNLGLFSFTMLVQSKRFGLAALAGLSTGVAIALRPNLILMVPLLLAWFVWVFKWKKGCVLSLLFVVAAALPIAPFTVHNYRVADDFILLSGNGGINFYFGNNPSSRGSFFVDDPTWGHIEYQHFMAKSIAEEEQGRPLRPSEVSDHWFQKGLDFIKEQPGAYAYLLFQKFKSFLENFEYAIIYCPSVERHLTFTLAFCFIPYAVIITGAGIGLMALILRVRRKTKLPSKSMHDAVGFEAEKWVPVFIILLANLATILLFFNYSRFRLIMVPSLILLGILGFRYAFYFLRHRSFIRLALLGGAGATSLVLSLVTSPWEEPMRELWRLQKSHGHATIAEAFSQSEKFKEAELYLSIALEILPDNSLTLSKRGRLKIRMEKYEGALADLEKALELSDSASNRAALAEFYGRETPYRDLDKALELIREAMTRPIQTPQIMANIRMIEGNIRMSRKEPEQAFVAFEEACRFAPHLTDTLFMAGIALIAAGNEKEAVVWLERCLQANPDHVQARMELQRIIQ